MQQFVSFFRAALENILTTRRRPHCFFSRPMSMQEENVRAHFAASVQVFLLFKITHHQIFFQEILYK